MPWFKRPDGTLLKNLPTFRRLNPYLMRTRTEATIFIPLRIDVTETLAYIKELEKQRGEKISIFPIILTSIGRTFSLRPELNRFCVGKALYQRNEISFSFVAKKQFKESAKETNIKMIFEPHETIFDVLDFLKTELNAARQEDYISDKDVDVFGKMPDCMLTFLTWLFRWLDSHNLAPGSMIKTDPLYCSTFITNMGSVGMKKAPLHHLFMWGTASLFLGINAFEKRPVVNEKNEIVIRDILELVITWDDRIADGFYGQKSAVMLQDFIEHPKQLEKPPEISEEILKELMLKPQKKSKEKKDEKTDKKK